jgi:hypothetical protein
MSTLLRPTAPALRDATPRLLSACLFHWDGAETDVASLCGRAGTFTRAATLAGVTDGAGATYTAPHSLPAWEMRDLDADSVREAAGLRAGTADFVSWPDPPAPQAMAGLLELVETGARTTANSTLFALANDAVTGARLWLDTSGTFYRLNYNDGSTTRTATLTSGQPTAGQRVRFRWTLSAAGAIQLWQSINGAAETTATATALALPAAWAAGARLRLNSRGATANPAQGWYRRAKLVAGAPAVAVLEALR